MGNVSQKTAQDNELFFNTARKYRTHRWFQIAPTQKVVLAE